MNNNDNRVIGYDPKTGNPIYAHNNYNPNITQNSNYQRQNQVQNGWQNNPNINNNTQQMNNYVPQNQQTSNYQNVSYNNVNGYRGQPSYNNLQGSTTNPNTFVNNNVNWQNRPVQNNPKKGKSSIFKLSATLFIIFIVVVIVLFLVFRNSDGYFFSNDDYSNYNNSGETNSGEKRTVIVDDHRYDNQNIRTESEAKKLIVQDSVDQKGSCPSEIVAIENEIISKYNITAVNLCEMDYEFAKGLEGVFAKIYSEYPEARKYLTNVTLSNYYENGPQGIIAAFMPVFDFAYSGNYGTYPVAVKMQVLLMSNYFLDKNKLERDIQLSLKGGHFPPNSNIYAPLAHELGHYISFIATLKHYGFSSFLMLKESDDIKIREVMDAFNTGSYSLDMIKEAYNRYKKEKGTNLSLDDWRATISGYAMAKNENGEYIYDETIAESFHDVFVNGDNACDASKYVIMILKERLRG